MRHLYLRFKKAIHQTEDIWINYVGQVGQSWTDNNPFLEVSYERLGWHMNPENKRPYLLFCYSEIRDNQFIMQWEYSTKAHHRATIEKVAHTFLDTMRGVVQELL